jgi:mono/diheme cytochrome c family protein
MKVLAALCSALLLASPLQAQEKKKSDPQVQRGRYLVQIAGCNDCHTANYAMTGGKVPEKDWLTGDALGWRGPWGTTYATNLRLYMQERTEEQWIKTAKTLKTRPPMPWFNLHDMTTRDLGAIYRFIRDLGPAGKPAPAYVAPDQTPSGPYVQFPAPPK